MFVDLPTVYIYIYTYATITYSKLQGSTSILPEAITHDTPRQGAQQSCRPTDGHIALNASPQGQIQLRDLPNG